MRHRNLFYLKQLFIMPLFLLFLGLQPQPAKALEDIAADYSDSYEPFSEAELAQMLAPIALYPDSLLAQILMASTYPIEVIEADRWINHNQDLTGDTLDVALLERDWDPSIKALCHFPSVLALMSERIGETTDIGNAFLAQEIEVTAMIQRLRAEAHTQGNLATTSQQTVVVQDGTILIVPADPTVIYVPYYDPYYVYGPWWYPAYPPFYWGPVGVDLGFRLSYWPGVHFGFSFGSWSYFDWHRHTIHIDVHRRPRFVRHDHWIVRSDRWQHAPHHRRGVSYRNPQTARKYGQTAAHFSGTRSEGRRLSGQTNQDRIYRQRGKGKPAIAQRPARNENSWRDRRQQELRHNVPARKVERRSGGEMRDQTRLNRERTKQRPATGHRQVRERSERNPAQRANLNRSKQQRQSVEPVRQVHQPPAPRQQGQAQLKPARPTQQPAAKNRQFHERSERNPAQRANLVHSKQQRQPVKPVRQVHQPLVRKPQGQAQLKTARPSQRPTENKHQVRQQPDRKPQQRANLNRAKQQRQKVAPTPRVVREKKRVQTAEKGMQQQKNLKSVKQVQDAGQFSKQPGSGSGKRFSGNRDRSGRGYRSSDTGKDNRKERGKSR